MTDQVKNEAIKAVGVNLMAYKNAQKRLEALNDSLSNKSLTDLQRARFEAMKALETEEIAKLEKNLADQKKAIEKDIKMFNLK